MSGFGFRVLKAFNETLLIKERWGIFENPDSLTSQKLVRGLVPFGRAFHSFWVISKGGYQNIDESEIIMWQE